MFYLRRDCLPRIGWENLRFQTQLIIHNLFGTLFILLEQKMSQQPPEIKTKTIAETNNYIAWSAEEPDGETTYHLELNNITLHFFQEEWQELMQLIKALTKSK
jgi:hypothetical protein